MTPREAEIIALTREFVRKRTTDQPSHNWDHIERVEVLSVHIARECGANEFVVTLMALLHELGDWKFAGGDRLAGLRTARNWLKSLGLSEKKVIRPVVFLVRHNSFQGGTNPVKMRTLEQQCVQDADCCDRLGVLGLLRSHEFGLSRSRPLFDPSRPPIQYDTAKEFAERLDQETTITFLRRTAPQILNRMNTNPGQRLANRRYFQLLIVLQMLEEQLDFGHTT